MSSDLLSKYDVRDGIVHRLGKFQGEPLYVVLLWDFALEGGSDEDLHDGDCSHFIFTIDPALVEECLYRSALRCGSELEAHYGEYLCLWENEQGFVHHEIMSPIRYAQFRAYCEQHDTPTR